MEQLHDVHIMYKDDTMNRARAVATPFYNMKYPLAVWNAQMEVKKYKKLSAGHFYIITKNGESPHPQLNLGIADKLKLS